MASRRRRRKNIGGVIAQTEARVRRVEKRPGSTRLKRNVVSTEKIQPRAVVTKVIATDAVTANEAAFGVTVVTDTQPTEYLKEGTTWVDPDTGSTQIYSTDINDFIVVTDPVAQATADDKNKTYVQTSEPTGGTYNVGDLWIDTDDGNKLYRYSGSAWVSAQDTAISTAQSTANGKNKVYYSTSTPGSTANTAGDIWWQYSSGIVIGQYVGAGGTSWTSAPIGNAVIANLDAGKITTGYLDVAGSVVITTDQTKSGNQARIELNSSGFFAYNGSTTTVSITNSGTALFTGSITGSSFTSTNYSSGTGIAIKTVSGGDIIDMTVGGSSKGTITAVTGGLVISSGDAQLVLTAAGNVQLVSQNNILTMSSAAYLTTSGSNTGGGYGSLRNTWASSSDPSGGDLGDVWLKWV